VDASLEQFTKACVISFLPYFICNVSPHTMDHKVIKTNTAHG